MKKQKEREEKLKNMLKKNKGITLIALVVTIVVLIILATISINAVLGEDGLIKQAEKASQMQANAEASDNGVMDILDKYIEDASAVKKEPGLQIKYTTEDIGSNAKVVNLSYSIGIGEGTTAEDIEAKIEELTGMTVTDELRNEAKKEASTIGITYEEYLLEIIFQETAGETITEEIRIELQTMATETEMTYQEILEYLLKEMAGITFGQILVTTEELENMVVELYKSQGQEITFDDEYRAQLQQVATSLGMTYEEFLRCTLELYGVDASGVTTEISIGNTNINCIRGEFIATRNGTYTVKSTAKNGMQAERQIEVTGIEEERFSRIYTTTQEYTDANGKTATIPAGFAVGTSNGINTIDDGLVITDAIDNQGCSIGNEFVWIPVESDETFIREGFGDGDWNTTNYTEPYPSGYSDGNGTEEAADYNTMRTQVLKYHGFYIGRYEAGVNSATFRIGATEAQEVVSKRGVAPYNCVKWGDSMTSIGTNGAVYLAQNIYTGKEQAKSVTSTLCYGVQWDAMCRYIGEAEYTRNTPRKDGVDVTGRVGGDQSKNIYDLAGNCYEWTMESGEQIGRVLRGGEYDCAGTVSFRGYTNVDNYDDNNSFRCTLYIN